MKSVPQMKNGGAEYYNVTDFYRLKCYSEDRIRLLDFERPAGQVFDPKQSVITDDGLLLGNCNKNVPILQIQREV